MPPFQFYLRLICLNCHGLSPDFLVEIFYWDINSNLPLRHFDIGSRKLAPGSTDCDSVECPRSCAEIAGNINYLYCQIPEMMPVVKPTQDTTPAPPHHSWAQPVNKDRNSSLPEIARGVSWCRDLGSAFIKYLPAKYSLQFRWVFSVMFPCVTL